MTGVAPIVIPDELRFRRYALSREIAPIVPKDANGKRRCRWCHGRLPKGRRSWCSERCAMEVMVRSSPNVARWEVEKRDKGVCALCHARTRKIKERLRFVQDATAGRYYDDHSREKLTMTLTARAYRINAVRDWLKANYPWALYQDSWSDLWEMDHTVPVVEGGGCCGLDGLRTLCIGCHRKVTADLAARRARERREEKMPLLRGVA